MKADDLRAAGVQLEQVATVEVVVGYLVTHADGTVARLGPDRGYADRYLRTHGGTAIDEMFVRRKASPAGPMGSGGPIEGVAMAG